MNAAESDHPGPDHPESDHNTSDPRLEWATPAAALFAVAGGGIVLAFAAVFSSDAPSRLLIGLAAVLLLCLVGLGVRQRPRLTVVPGSPARLVVRGLLGPATYTPDQILRARVVAFRRMGRRVPNLELDVRHKDEDRLVIFGRWDLGTHPQDVLDVMTVHGLVPDEPRHD